MKHVISLLIAALLIGSVLTAIFYWIVKWPLADAVGVGGSAAAGALVAEAIRAFTNKRKEQKLTGKMRK